MATETLPAQEASGQLFHQLGAPKLSPSSSSLFLPDTTTAPIIPRKTSRSPSPTTQHHEQSLPSLPIPSPDLTPRPKSIDLSHISPFKPAAHASGPTFDIKHNEDIDLPDYGNSGNSLSDEGYESSQTARSVDDEHDGPDFSITTGTTRSDSPLATPVVADDTMIKQAPSRHVDYLSHDWREEDIWASWRHIVSQRKVFGQRSRLENASWRTWAKSKHRLRTVSPERLNWLKESDVTWLYGPLKLAESHPITSDTSNRTSSQISKSGSFVNKKPILKKRSVSEVMLQKSLSSSSLVKQAAASVQAQERKHPSQRRINRITSDLFSSESSISNPPSRDGDEFDYFSSRTSTNSNGTPSAIQMPKQLRFDEKVDQCIAVECIERSIEDDTGVDSEEDDPPNSALTEPDSDEGLFMSDRGKGLKKEVKGSRSNSTSSQMIETLPSTTLKYRTDSPDVDPEAQQHHVFGKSWGSNTLSPSPSQETLRPSRPSRNFLLADDDEDGEVDTSSTWSFGRSNPNSSLGASASTQSAPDFSPADGYDGIDGMRRTESGMFMPYDEDEDDAVAEGLFGRVSETINTFRDISHVLWNVGWRK